MKTLTELMELADDLTEICVDSASAESVEELTEYIKRIREAKTALQTALAELIAENERLTKEAMYGAEFTHSDDAMFERIERAARASFNRHRRATRGQQCTRADAYETHLVWATQQEVKAERDAAIAERDALKADAERLDWFETQGISYGFEGVLEGNRWGVCGPFTTLRTAIDAAMKGTS
jgi:valyl-tRNA synthetase